MLRKLLIILPLLVNNGFASDDCTICKKLGENQDTPIEQKSVKPITSCLNSNTFSVGDTAEKRAGELNKYHSQFKASDWDNDSQASQKKIIQSYFALYFGKDLARKISGQNPIKKLHYVCKALWVDMDGSLKDVKKFVGSP